MNKKIILRNILIVLFSISMLVIIIGGIIYLLYTSFTNSSKLVCKSETASITLLYDENNLNGFFTNGVEFDLDLQQELAEDLGIDEYLIQYKEWFESNQNGTCTYEKSDEDNEK